MALPPLLEPAAFSEGTNGAIAADDPRVQSLIGGATAAIRRRCGWHIAPVVTTENLLLDGSGGLEMHLPTLHLVDVLAVANAGAAVDVGNLEWSIKGLLRFRSGSEWASSTVHGTYGRWTHQYRGVQVTFQHGYDLADVADLQQIIQQVVANAIASPLGATREQAGNLAISWATTAPGVSGGLSLLQRDLDLLNLYRLEKSC